MVKECWKDSLLREMKNCDFQSPPIFGLFPLILYIILAFRKGMHPVVNVAICAVIGAVLVMRPSWGSVAFLLIHWDHSWLWSALSLCSVPASVKFCGARG